MTPTLSGKARGEMLGRLVAEATKLGAGIWTETSTCIIGNYRIRALSSRVSQLISTESHHSTGLLAHPAQRKPDGGHLPQNIIRGNVTSGRPA